jgi:hypothetical protein
MEQQLVWHYAIGVRAWDIRFKKVIHPAAAPEGARAIVWFSARQDWEPTASKGVVVNDVYRTMTIHEMAELTGGLWRFGRTRHGLLGWRSLRYAAQMSGGSALRLLVAANKAGAEAAMWYGCLEPVPLNECVVERLHDPEGKWSAW